MNNTEILTKVKQIKANLVKDSISIIGIFGSYGRNDFTNSSDVDILYEIPNPQEFAFKNGGFGAFIKLDEIKASIAKELNKKVDLTAKNSLNEVGKKYILKDLVYL